MLNRLAWLAACALCLLSSRAVCQDEPSGRDILQASSDAIGRMNGALLNVKRYGTDTYAARESTGEARMQILRDPDQSGGSGGGSGGGSWLVRISGAASPRGGSALVDFDVVWASGEATWLDHKNKKVMVRPEGAARAESVALAKVIRPAALLTTPAFVDELASDSISLLGEIRVEGVMCDHLEIVNPKTKRKVRLAIGRNDKLPRRFEALSASASIAGSAVLDILEFNSAIEVRADAFLVPLPEGYTRDVAAAPVSSKPPEGTTQDTAAPGKPPTPPGEGVVPSAVTLPVAAPFELERPDGTKLMLESLAGRVVVLDFFGSWSLPARDLHGELKTLMEELAGKPVTLLALSVREKNKEAPARALADSGAAFTLLLEADDVARAYGVTTYPTLILINTRGEIVHRAEGFKKSASPVPALKAKIFELLGEPAPPQPEKPLAPATPAPSPI